MSMENKPMSPDIKPDDTFISQEDFEQEERKLDFVEKIVDENYEKISEIVEAINEKFDIGIDFENIDENTFKDALRKVLIIRDNISIESLKIGSLFDRRIMAISMFLIPLVEKKVEIAERELKGEEISIAEKMKETAKVILPENEKEDYENINKAGELLDKLGDTLKGKKAIVVKMFAKLLKNVEVQKGVSEKFREWLKENEEKGESIEESVGEIIKEELAEK